MIAIFTLGANDFQITKMVEFAKENWGSSERYAEELRLIDCAKKGMFDKVIVFDREALSSKTTNVLNSINVNVLCWKEGASLKSALDKKNEMDAMNKRRLEEHEKNMSEIKRMLNY